METTKTTTLRERSLIEAAGLIAKALLDADCIVGDMGGHPCIGWPDNDTERAYARCWATEDYSWSDMVDDIDLTEADDIMSSDMIAAIRSGYADEDAIRADLRDADEETRERARDAVTWYDGCSSVIRAMEERDEDALVTALYEGGEKLLRELAHYADVDLEEGGAA